MIEALNFYELQHIIKWYSAISGKGKKATLGDLQKYIIDNGIKTRARLLNKLHADFMKLPE